MYGKNLQYGEAKFPILFLKIPSIYAKWIFRSQFFSVCPSVNFGKFNFYVKLNYGTPHMTIYFIWTGSGPEVDRK